MIHEQACNFIIHAYSRNINDEFIIIWLLYKEYETLSNLFNCSQIIGSSQFQVSNLFLFFLSD